MFSNIHICCGIKIAPVRAVGKMWTHNVQNQMINLTQIITPLHNYTTFTTTKNSVSCKLSKQRPYPVHSKIKKQMIEK